MKKTLRRDRQGSIFNTSPVKLPVTSYPIAPKILFEQDPKKKSDRQVNVICPNCQFHFKIQLKLQEHEKRAQEIFGKSEESLEKIIERQFSLISNYSRVGSHIQNSPILKLKNQQRIELAWKEDYAGLERLQKLNQLSELQKSRMQESRVTVRFNPSPKDSPVEQYQQFKEKPSPAQSKHHQIVQQPSISLSPKQLNSQQKALIQQKIFDYFEMMQTLNAVLSWIIANEHYYSLPSYIRLLINGCQEKLNANGFD